MAPTRADKLQNDPPKGDLSLDDMLKISRQKKENEKAAQNIFGKDRRASAPGALGKRRTTDGLPSLASRVGVQKHNSRSSTNLKRDAQAKSRALAMRPSPLKNTLGAATLSSRIGSNFQPRRPAPPPAPNPPPPPAQTNISIRGIAGPVTVMASNFAPGTTAADIRSAFEPVGGEMLSCRLKSANPTVIAEMIFADRAGADTVVETFNNQKADGRLLYVYIQAGGAGVPTAPAAQHQQQTRRVQNQNEGGGSGWIADNRRNGADPEYQDGRYGFSTREDEGMDVELDQPQENGSDRYHNTSRADERSSYREERPNDRRYDRGPRQDRGLYSDKYARGGSSSGRGWR